MKINPINIVHTLIIWQSILFALVLFTPKYNKKKSNRYLSLLLLTLGIHFIYNILYSNGYFLDILPAYSCSYGFLYGPLIFLHIKFYLAKDASFKPLYWLHFFPFILILILTSIGYSVCNTVAIWIFPMMLTYCLFSFREIYIYNKTIAQVSSMSYTSETKWLKTILIIMLLIVFLNILQTQMSFVNIGRFEVSMEALVQIGVLFLVNIITYQGLKSPQSFQQISDSDVEMSRSNELKNGIASIDKNTLQKLAEKLEKYMKQDQPYLNPELNINTLAEAVEVPEKTISQTINHVIGSNFSDYVNSYRIADAKLKLEAGSEESLSIKEIMYDVGFNSRSVFNSVFKKKTGLTPSEYKKHHK